MQTRVVTWWRRFRRVEDPAERLTHLAADTVGGFGDAYVSLAEHLANRALGRSDDLGELEWLGRQDPTVWRRLDAAARELYRYPSIYARKDELRRLLSADCSTLLGVVASFHRSGYVRERAVEILETRPEPAASKALTLRCADWVDVVRARAQTAVLERVDRESALAVVPLLVATVDQDRSRGLLQQYVAGISSDAVTGLARSGDRATRRLLVERVDLAEDDLMRRATEDDDPVVRCRAAALLLARRPAAAGELVDRGSGLVVALAIAAAPDDIVMQRADRLLLDRRVAVRGAAQRRLALLRVDVYSRYAELVDAPDPPPRAVVGLAETGGHRAAVRIAPLAVHVDGRVRRAAILASQWALSGSELVTLCATALHDESELVVSAATRILRRCAASIPRQVLLDAIASPSRPTRRAGLRLARRSDAWTRLEADLLFAVDTDADLAGEGRADLAAWGGGGLHGYPLPEQRDTILRLLDDAGLGTSTREWILFCLRVG